MRVEPRLKRGDLAAQLIEDPSVENLDRLVPLTQPPRDVVRGSKEAMEYLDKIKPLRYALFAILCDAIAVESGVLSGRFADHHRSYVSELAEIPGHLDRLRVHGENIVEARKLEDLQNRINGALLSAWNVVAHEVRNSVFEPHFERLCRLEEQHVDFDDRANGSLLLYDGEVLIDGSIRAGIANQTARGCAVLYLCQKAQVPESVGYIHPSQIARQNPQLLLRLTTVPIHLFQNVIAGLKGEEILTGQYLIDPQYVVVEPKGRGKLRLEYRPLRPFYGDVPSRLGVDRCPAAADLEGTTAEAFGVECPFGSDRDAPVAGNLVVATYLTSINEASGIFWDPPTLTSSLSVA